MKKLSGIIPVTMSPIKPDGSIDSAGYRRMIDFTLAYGMGGLWVLGSAGEDFLIPYSQRVEIARTICEQVGGRVPIIMGAAFSSLIDTHRFFDDTAGMPIDAYHILPPDRKMGEALAVRYLMRFADACPKPVWFYNNPLRALKIPANTVRQLSSHPNVAGIKAAGYDLWTAGKISEARERAFRISHMIAALPHPENTEFCAEEKVVMEIMGLCTRHVYPPFRECSDQEREQARKVLVENGVLDYYRDALMRVGATME